MRNIRLNAKVIASLQAAYFFLHQEIEEDQELMGLLLSHIEKRQAKLAKDLEEHKDDIEKVNEYADRIRQKLENK